MLQRVTDRLVFAAPEPSYTVTTYAKYLCWVPQNEAIPGLGADNVDIPCLWLPAEKAATVVLYFHANAEDLGMSFLAMKHMRDQLQVNVMAVEYPGYGLLRDIRATEEGIYCAARTAFRFLVDVVKVEYPRIVILGRSLGSGPAVHLASQYPIGGLILVNAFTTLRAAVRGLAGDFLAWLFPDSFNNERLISNVSCATLFIHGSLDRLVPAEHSVRLFKKCRSRKLLVTPPRMEHNSHLFADPGFLAVPSIHFFCFPGYRTERPPQVPAHLFEKPKRSEKCPPTSGMSNCSSNRWLCAGSTREGCLGSMCDKVDGEMEVPASSLQDRVEVPSASLPQESAGKERQDAGSTDAIPEPELDQLSALFARRGNTPNTKSTPDLAKWSGTLLSNKADGWLVEEGKGEPGTARSSALCDLPPSGPWETPRAPIKPSLPTTPGTSDGVPAGSNETFENDPVKGTHYKL